MATKEEEEKDRLFAELKIQNENSTKQIGFLQDQIKNLTSKKAGLNKNIQQLIQQNSANTTTIQSNVKSQTENPFFRAKQRKGGENKDIASTISTGWANSINGNENSMMDANSPHDFNSNDPTIIDDEMSGVKHNLNHDENVSFANTIKNANSSKNTIVKEKVSPIQNF